MANEPDDPGPGRPSLTYSELEKRLATLKGEDGGSAPTYESLEKRHQALKGPPSETVSTQDLLRRFVHLTGEEAIANGHAGVEAQVSQTAEIGGGQKHVIDYLNAATDEGFDMDMDEVDMLMAQVEDTEQADMPYHALAAEPALAAPSTNLTEAERLMVEMQDQLTLSKKHEGPVALSGFEDDACADESDEVQRIILAAKERALLDAKYEKANPTETAKPPETSAPSTCSSSEELSTSDDDY